MDDPSRGIYRNELRVNVHDSMKCIPVRVGKSDRWDARQEAVPGETEESSSCGDMERVALIQNVCRLDGTPGSEPSGSPIPSEVALTT